MDHNREAQMDHYMGLLAAPLVRQGTMVGKLLAGRAVEPVWQVSTDYYRVSVEVGNLILVDQPASNWEPVGCCPTCGR